MRWGSLCVVLFLLSNSWAQQLRVGIFRDFNIPKITISYAEGSYTIIADTTLVGVMVKDEFVDVELNSDNRLTLYVGAIEIGSFERIWLVATKANNSLSYLPKTSGAKERKYKDDVELIPTTKGITLVNLVDIQNYLKGVVESEGGGGKELEYYKVQALMSRTYALKYTKKHEKEGFGLCDGVHCQAYHHQLRFAQRIDTAVNETENMVMIDETGQLVDAYFHANCGGQTSEAKSIWNKDISYLSTFRDTFCIYTKQASWEKRIPQQEWVNFLVARYNYPIADSVLGPMIFTFNQPDRATFFQYPWLGIPLRDIREEFNLRSTFFNCYPEGQEVVLRGRGFGHGVGLCQEGAMKMAKYGYNFLQIALYYFPGVRVINIQDKIFFNQNVSDRWKNF